MTRKELLRSSIVSICSMAALLLLSPSRAVAGSATTLHTFELEALGGYPNGGLVADSVGNLYGVAAGGGPYSGGVVFEFTPTQQGGWNEQILYAFQDGSDGGGPEGGLVFDASGNLYGTVVEGGTGSGAVFELKHNADGSWSEHVLHAVGDKNSHPESGVVLDDAGNLYGVIGSGGAYGAGEIFRLSPSANGWQETVLYSFHYHGDGGWDPVGPLVVDKGGNIFGVTEQGGSACAPSGCGVAFELTPSSGEEWNEIVLHTFTGESGDGSVPFSGLIPDSAGNLYGTTGGGGSANPDCFCGTVFELSPGSDGQWTESILYAFQGGSDGDRPVYQLAFDGAGNLYGVTSDGGGLGYCGNDGCGTAFELSPNGSGQWSEIVLFRFDYGATPEDPTSGVFVNSAGQVFGEAAFGTNAGQNGVVFELTPSAGQWSLSDVSTFTNGDGVYPRTTLVEDQAGNLFGTTITGGAFNEGSVYELELASGGGWNEKMIYSFTPQQVRGYGGPNPSALIVDSAGNLYGETQEGGQFGGGMVYELSPAANGTWIEKTLFSFKGWDDGHAPQGGLVMDRSGNLYGTTEYGGSGSEKGKVQTGNGVVFELHLEANGVWSEKVLYRFGGYPSDGAHSQAGLVFDHAGNLFGTTFEGGSSSNCTSGGRNPVTVGCGTAFELTPEAGSWREVMLHSFLGSTSDGQYPLSRLVLDPAGNVYGTTYTGGTDGAGTAYELSPVAGRWSETLVFVFQSDIDGGPVGEVIFDNAGNLYGTTAGAGSVFELSPNATGPWTYTFVGSLVGASEAGLIFGPNGYLYGTTDDGGSFNVGTVFEIAP
jgi:uncharacterized repeat protein (TIGR03803 family)